MAESQYVVFKLDEGEFGIDIMNVREIIPYEDSVSVPDTASYVDGIINHRGSVIPIIDLRKKFKLKQKEIGKETRIIVINLDGKETGFLVDEASQTVRIDDSIIDSTPNFVGSVDKKYMTGVAKLDDKRLLILIDLEMVLSEDEIKDIKSIEG